MITFDVLTLKAFFDEQINFLSGARINKIQQPTRREFIFSLRNNGKTRQLYVNINPQFYHVCFIEENNNKRMIEIPQKPPMFCMLMRKYLENAKIIKVVQPENERILELHIETNNAVGESIYPCLAIELMGKHSNVILYNSDTGVIIGCAHNVGAEKSRKREVFGGIPYIYPPRQTNFDRNNFKSLISEYDLGKYSSINKFIDAYYSDYIYNSKFNELKTQYKTLIDHKLRKASKSLEQMESRLLSDNDFDKFRLLGDLLMANLYNLKDFSKSVAVYDYENGKEVTISLNESKTIKENANHFYKLYAKAKNARAKLSELISLNKDKKLYFEQIIYSIESAKTPEDLLEIAPEIKDSSKIPIKSSKNIAENIITITKSDSTKIYIGKNNKQNDYIISKLANDDDLWFHVHNNAGSHVLLKTSDITDELILECAKFAKEYSSVKNSSKIGVIYTRRKYLRKPPGANLGYVTYKNEKEIILD
ncbi:NFACT family protein [bacterium]|nr:NFACT family protein [bacterium]